MKNVIFCDESKYPHFYPESFSLEYVSSEIIDVPNELYAGCYVDVNGVRTYSIRHGFYNLYEHEEYDFIKLLSTKMVNL